MTLLFLEDAVWAGRNCLECGRLCRKMWKNVKEGRKISLMILNSQESRVEVKWIHFCSLFFTPPWSSLPFRYLNLLAPYLNSELEFSPNLRLRNLSGSGLLHLQITDLWWRHRPWILWTFLFSFQQRVCVGGGGRVCVCVASGLCTEQVCVCVWSLIHA